MANTYSYGVNHNLTPSQLFFLIMIEETMDELGIDDAVGIAMIIAGSRLLPTRGKFAGAVKGTSYASEYSRLYLDYEIKYKILPTFTSWKSVFTWRVMWTKNIGKFVGRAIPGVGWAITAANLVTIGYKTTRKYNSIVKPEDRISYSRIAYGGR